MRDLRGINSEDMELIGDIIYLKLLKLLRDNPNVNLSESELLSDDVLENLFELLRKWPSELNICEISPKFEDPTKGRIITLEICDSIVKCDLDIFLKIDSAIEKEFKKSLDRPKNEEFWENAKINREIKRSKFKELEQKLLSRCE